MTNVFRSMHATRRISHASLLLVLLACLLITIRLVAGFLCSTCFYNEFEQSTARSLHLHAGGDRNPCHHGKPESNPLIKWACAVTQDVSAFILPEIPRLPVLVAFIVPLFVIAVSYEGRSLVAAHGRGPPVNVLID